MNKMNKMNKMSNIEDYVSIILNSMVNILENKLLEENIVEFKIDNTRSNIYSYLKILSEYKKSKNENGESFQMAIQFFIWDNLEIICDIWYPRSNNISALIEISSLIISQLNFPYIYNLKTNTEDVEEDEFEIKIMAYCIDEAKWLFIRRRLLDVYDSDFIFDNMNDYIRTFNNLNNGSCEGGYSLGDVDYVKKS